ncbi:MAG: sugar kinase [Chthoniobacterales bacterium]|nr:sugar kinase [Chthoniobacterales bacterium]
MSHYDLISLGEVMLRMDPGEGRVRTARQFTAWEGGGEYNVARGLRRCFGLRTAVVTALVDNEIGHLIEDLILQGGVDTQFIKWRAHDGIGKSVRNALNFTERGFGLRGARGCVDRGHSAASQLTVSDFDFDKLFAEHKTHWFHTGGIFAALSTETAELTLQGCQAARKHGVKVSYDLNYRASLWQERGGFSAAQELNRRILPYVEVVFGALSDKQSVASSAALSDDILKAEAAQAEEDITVMRTEFPNLQVAAATLRRVHTATRNDWGSIAWIGDAFYRSRTYPNLELLDRIGGGDSFAAGLIYGMLTGQPPQLTLEIATAHGALAMTTPGDTGMATLQEVLELAGGGNARVRR